MMKNIYIQILVFLTLSVVISQSVKAQEFSNLDKSPHDIAYYRVNKITPPTIKVLYGRPQKDGREIFGSLIPFGEVWRVGANESTEIRFYQDIIFGGERVNAGTYALYAIPGETEWTVILSSNIDMWGSKGYKDNMDVARAKAKVSKAEFVEAFSIGFKDKGRHVNMILAWDTTRITVPIKFEK